MHYRLALAILPLAAALWALPLTTSAPSGYSLVWADEFDGTALNSANWVTGWWYGQAGNGDITYYDPTNVTVSNGQLHLRAAVENKIVGSTTYTVTGAVVTTGRIGTSGALRHTVTDGYVEASIRMATGSGWWPAFWMVSQYGEAPSPLQEFDVIEHLTAKAPQTMYMTYHNPDSITGAYNTGADLSQGFHTYGALRQNGHVVWYYDGTPVRTFDDSGIDLTPLYVILSIGTGSWPGYATGGSTEMDIDYVRVYAPAPSTPTPLPPTATPTPTYTPVSTATFTASPTATATSTATATATATATFTSTSTPITITATATPSPIGTLQPSPTATPTRHGHHRSNGAR